MHLRSRDSASTESGRTWDCEPLDWQKADAPPEKYHTTPTEPLRYLLPQASGTTTAGWIA